MNVKEAAALYISRGWQVVPLSPRTKDCYSDNWQKLIFTPEDFEDNDNIGIKSIDGLVDIDLDSDEVVALASNFLPDTTAIYGRKSKPSSHRLYSCKEPPPKTIPFVDFSAPSIQAKSTLIEIRVNHQSMAPPSVHPEGETVEWEENGNATEIQYSELKRSVQFLATSALIARYYAQKGHRHAWIVPMAGSLRHLHLNEDEAVKIIQAAGSLVQDDELGDRIRVVRSTFARSEDEPLASMKTLEDLMVEGKDFVRSLRKIWGAEGKDFRGFITDNKQRVIPNNQENVRKAIIKLGFECYEDSFANKIYVRHEKFRSDKVLDDALADKIWLLIDEKYHFQPSYIYFQRVIMDYARRIKVHPVLNYLDSIQWDGKSRIDTWLVDCAGAEDSEYVRAISSIVLIAAVRRVRHPGCKFDEMLILESSQGTNKSSALIMLCPNPKWFSDDLPLGSNAKETIERTSGIWIVEAAELQGMRKREVERLRSFLSRQKDGPVRLAYGRLPTEVYRQFIIIGSINPGQYLKDVTGNRRFWPVEIQAFDLNKIEEIRDQLWAEAAKRESDKESIRLDPNLYSAAEDEQLKRTLVDPWEATIARALPSNVKHRIASMDAIWDVLGVPIERQTIMLAERVTNALLRLGFRRMSIRDENKKGKVVKGWGRDPTDEDYDLYTFVPDKNPEI